MKPAGFESEQLKRCSSLRTRAHKLELRAAAATLETESGLEDNSAQADISSLAPEPPSPSRTKWITRPHSVGFSEQRDRKIASFWINSRKSLGTPLRMRAENPGQFHAHPVMGGAKYVPELRCNSDVSHIFLEDRE
jgi:hypothetical protein